MKYGSIFSLSLLIRPIHWQIREDVKTACVYVESLTKEFVFTMKDVTQLLVKVRGHHDIDNYLLPDMHLLSYICGDQYLTIISKGAVGYLSFSNTPSVPKYLSL